MYNTVYICIQLVSLCSWLLIYSQSHCIGQKVIVIESNYKVIEINIHIIHFNLFHTTMTSIFTPGQSYQSFNNNLPDTSPSNNDLINYTHNLSYDQLIQTVDTRLALLERCIQIGDRIIDNCKNCNVSNTNNNKDNTDTQYNELKTSLQNTLNNSNEAYNELNTIINTMYDIGHKDNIDNITIEKHYNNFKVQLKQMKSNIDNTQKQYHNFDKLINKRNKQQYNNNDTSVKIDIDKQQQQVQQQTKSTKNNNDIEFEVVDEYSQQQQLELDNELLERQKFIQQIEHDILIVQQMFIELNELVYEQQSNIDSIEQSIINTANQTYSGMKQLYIAEQYQRKKRNRMCCIVLLITLIILTVIMTVSIILHG